MRIPWRSSHSLAEVDYLPAPYRSDYEAARVLKHGKDVNDILKNATVGIAGLGGLGSNIAMMLARAGVGKLIIADHDNVDISNMTRQNYYYRHLGMKKTDATVELLSFMDPNIEIEKHFVKLDPDNLEGIFNECNIVCEALDDPKEKAMLINNLLIKHPDVIVVSGSGMAGYGKSNDIRTEHAMKRLYVCGDGIDMEFWNSVMMSPRVNICAGHMANTVIAVLMKKKV